MKFSELISKIFTSEDLSLIQGIEKKLRSRRRKERNGIYLLGAALLFAMVRQLAGEDVFIWDNFKNFWDFLVLIFKGDWTGAYLYYPIWELLVIGIISTLLLFYFLVIRTQFLESESEEPFRYTFWVNSFEEVQDTPPKSQYTLDRSDRFKLLHHDLMERLNSRIRRLSLLKLDELTTDNSKTDPSYFEPARDLQSKLVAHIQIGGVYSIREERDHDWVIHVMPTVRIGSRGNPSILGYSVKFPLEKDNKLTAGQYNQFIERVYSSVATELYKQIELDVQEKMNLFPSSRLRAVALFNEAKDFARSNTIDAYDRAILLYREALRYFEISQIRPLTDFLMKRYFFWRFTAKPVYLQAKIQIGFIKCLVYRRIVSALTGRSINPLFEIRPIIDEMIDRLPRLHEHFRKRSLDPLPIFFTFPKDSWIRHKLRFIIPSESSFEKRSQILFDAYLVAALGYFYLGSYLKAPDYLNTAKSINPKLSDRNPIFLMTAGLIEPDLNESILLLRQATETAPDFQIAQYLLAERSDMLFRMKNEITSSRVVSVAREYDKVLNINPGNVAALAAQGYLWWLVGDLQSAKKKFEEGCELKSIAADTFVGELTYGLARIAAEEGRFNDAHDLFHQAISADPGIATYSAATSNATYTFYDQMVPHTLGRYQFFKGKVKNHHRRKMRGTINFELRDLKDPIGVAVKFKYAKDDAQNVQSKDDRNVINNAEEKNPIHDKNPIYAYIKEKFNAKTKTLLEELNVCCESSLELSTALVEELNRMLKCKTFYDKDRFKEVILSEEAHRLIRQNPNNEKLYRLNRLLLEEVFPYELIKYEDVNKSTIDSVLSHVLNDYGNACLGYYARFGEVFRHEIAIKLFSKAIELDRENVIARFNQYLGYTWKGGEKKQDLLNNIQEVLQKYPNQKAIVFTLAQSILREPEEIREKRKEIEEYKTRILVKGEPARQEKQVDATGEAPAIGGIDKKPIIDTGRIKQLEADLKVLEESWSTSVVKVKDLSIKNSKFSSLFDPSMTKSEAFKPRFRKLNDFFSRNKLPSERLNEHDVRALKVLCHYLLTNEKLKIDIREIESIFQNILAHFWPEDFDIDTILERYKQTSDAHTIERRRSYINYWLRQDPVHYFNLGWLDPKYFGSEMKDIQEQLTRAETEISRIDPKNASYWNMLANVYYSFKNYKNALPNYEKAKDLRPGVAVYHSNLGLAYYNLENWKSAIEAFEKATELDSGNASYFNDLGNAYYGSEDYKNALPNYEKAKDLEEDVAVYHSNFGLAHYNLEHWHEAIEAFSKATEMDEQNASYFNNLGNAYYGSQDYKAALANYQKAKVLRPEVAAYHSNIGLAYYNLANWREAIEAITKATEMDDGNSSYFNNLGNAYYGSQDYKTALANYEKAKVLKSDVAVYYTNIGLAHYNLKNWKNAIEAFGKATALAPENAGNFNDLGNAYYATKDFKNALANYEKATALKPDVAVYYTNIGLANNELMNWQNAVEAFTKATELAPENAGNFNSLGNVYYRIQDNKNALANYKKAKELSQNVAVYHSNIGLAYYNLSNWSDAIEAFRAAVELDSGNALNFNDLANAYYNRGLASEENKMDDYSNAAEQYLKALEIAPGNFTYTQSLIAVCELIHPPANGITYLEKALLIDPGNTYLKDELKKHKH